MAVSVIFWTTVNAFDTPSDERVLQAPNGASRDRHQCVLAGHLGRVLINRDCSAIAGCRKRRERIALEAQAIFFRRRHQPRRPPLARIRPGSPAPAMGPGTPSRLKSNSASSIWPAAEKCSLSDQKLVCSASAVLRYAYWKLLDEGGVVVSAHHCPHPDTRVLPLPLLGGVHTQAEPVPVPSTPGRTVC